jgi:membrane-bound lytic murein transglycosylase B
MHKKWFVGLWLFLTLFSLRGFAETEVKVDGWDRWVRNLRVEALSQGIRPEVFDKAFAGVRPNPRIQHFDRTQPETRISYLQYQKSRIDPFRIFIGRREYQKHRELLNKIAREYHVSPCMITALWGMESSYGRVKGNFPVIAALATLAYEGHRTQFFRHELLLALKILNDNHVSLDKFKGEWAGASGQTQFLPSSWYRYAVDYDHDGKKDIWNSLDDALASIANYLKKNDWHPDEPWAFQVELPENFDHDLIGLENKLTVSEWLELGVSLPQDTSEDLEAAIIIPEGGPPIMVFHNFKVIKCYNNSTFYAGSVGHLADKICSGL